MTDNYIYIFFHIPKTAGTTFIKHIKKNLAPDQYIHIDPVLLDLTAEYDDKKYRKAIKKYFSTLTKNQINKTKIIFGHTLPYGVHKYFNRDPRYFTFLRNPESRIISIYNYLYFMYEKESENSKILNRYSKIFLYKNNSPSFRDWYKNIFKNKSRDIALMNIHELLVSQEYGNNLDKFYYVGLTENFNNDSLYIYNKLGFNKFFISQNISKKTIKKLDKKIGQQIRLDNKKAFDVYKKAKKHNTKFITTNSDYYSAIKKYKIKRKFLLPITQTLFDFPEYVHITSAYLRTKLPLYTSALDFLKSKYK